MKILGILGSPRRQGNSEILLDRALEGAKAKGHNIEKIVLNELDFSPCQECGGCDVTGQCVINDDMQFVYKKLEGAEVIVIASPIFFGSLPAQVKAMIDRHQCAWVAKYVLKKKAPRRTRPGLLILVSATKINRFLKNAESIIKNLFAVLDIESEANLYCQNVDEKAKILKHPKCLKQAYNLGKALGEKG